MRSSRSFAPRFCELRSIAGGGPVNATKRHHVIPRMHLRHFAGQHPPDHVWTYDALSGKVWSATPENTAVEGYFYSGERSDGSMDPALENLISKIEDAAVPSYE